MTEQEYRAYPAVNKSTLWELRRSPAHYKWALEHPRADSPALRFGRELHMAILQPEEFTEQYAVVPEMDRRTKEGRERWDRFCAALDGREAISQQDYDTIMAMYDAVWNTQDAADLLDGCKTELPVFWTDDATGMECKCRMDAVKPGVVVDLKTCADASTGAFLKDALRYGYDVQAAHYLRGYRTLYDAPGRFVFVAVEKTPPYAVNVITASDGFVDRGTWTLISLMDKLKECKQIDKWPGYGANELVLPEWAMIPDEDE